MVKLAIAAIVAVVFLGNPQVLSAVSDGVSKIFVSEMVAPPDPAPTPPGRSTTEERAPPRGPVPDEPLSAAGRERHRTLDDQGAAPDRGRRRSGRPGGRAPLGRGAEYVRYVRGLRVVGSTALATIQAKQVLLVELDWPDGVLTGRCTCSPTPARGAFCPSIRSRSGCASSTGHRHPDPWPSSEPSRAPDEALLDGLSPEELRSILRELHGPRPRRPAPRGTARACAGRRRRAVRIARRADQ